METLYYRNRQLLVLSIAVILIAGLSALMSLPRMEDPRLRTRITVVVIPFPGASAERVEALVAEPFERLMREIPEIEKVLTTSKPNVATGKIYIKESINDTAPIISKIRNKLNELRAVLPEGAGEPDFDEFRGAVAYSLTLGLRWEGETEPPMVVMTRLAEELADQLRNLNGTEQVKIFGAGSQEILVEADPMELAALGITPGQLSRAVSQADAKKPTGTLTNKQRRIPAEIAGELNSEARIRAIPLRVATTGETVTVGDVAAVRREITDPPENVAIIRGERGVIVAVRIVDGLKIDAWTTSARRIVDRFAEKLPPSLSIDIVFDQNYYTSKRISELAGNLFLGAGIVIFVVFLMMGWRSAILVGSALPISVALTLFGMRLLNIPLHQMSITGLIIALGLLIDTAIVMVDETRRKLAEDLHPLDAIQHSVHHLFMPLLGSTATTVIAFMPIVLLQGNVGEFIGMIGGGVILALLSSFFVAMTITPALAGLFGCCIDGARWWHRGLGNQALIDGYRGFIIWCLKRPVLAIIITFIPPALGFILAPQLRSQFFPAADRNQFYIQVRGPGDASLYNTLTVARGMDELLRSDEEIERVDWVVGSGAPPFYYNMVLREDRSPEYAQALVHTRSDENVAQVMGFWQMRLNAEFPGHQSIVRELGQGPPIESPIEVRVYGEDLDELRRIGAELRAVMVTLPEVVHTRVTLERNLPKLELSLSEEELAWAGLSLSDVSQQYFGALDGFVGGSILEGTEEMPVRVRFGDDIRGSIEGASEVQLIAPNLAGQNGSQNLGAGVNAWIPASALGPTQVVPDYKAIPRRLGRRIIEVKGYLLPNTLPEEVNKVFQERLKYADINLPDGYRIEAGGDAEEKNEAVGALLAYAPVLGVMMIAILVLSFRSFVLAAVLGVVAVMAFGMGLLTTYLTGYPFSFMGMIGTAGLVGVAINDSIVVLAAIRANRRGATGDIEGITAAVMDTSRHVMTTTLTTAGGFMPLILAGGGFWPPLAIVIAGGVSGATMTALIFIPSVYRLIGMYSPSSTTHSRALKI